MLRPSALLLAAASVLATLALLPGLALAATPKRTVPGELDALLAAGAIDVVHRDAWATTYEDAKRTLKKLEGTRRVQLAAVVATTRTLAADGRLTAQRAPLIFQTLERNRAWWLKGPLLRYGQRVTFADSRLIWQFYPGQGIQVQWLGTFGQANALFKAGRSRDADLRALLDEALSLAVPRAGGIAWESMFTFDGGAPPWVSGLSQGTAVQAFSRAAARLDEPRYFDAARGGLGIFSVPPPEGVRVATAAGAHYLQYSFAPTLLILNGFVQALNGIHDFAVYANDAGAFGLFASGEAQLRVELPRFDTGAWSLYSPQRESDLGYHVLVRDFLKGLCGRLRDDRATRPQPTPDPTLYCATTNAFTAQLKQPPTLTLRSTRATAKRPAEVRFTLGKISNVTLTLLRGDEVVFSRTARFGRGKRSFALRIRKAGTLHARLRAVDLAGNATAVEGDIAVRKAPKAKRKAASG